jgi:hypothetical protein
MRLPGRAAAAATMIGALLASPAGAAAKAPVRVSATLPKAVRVGRTVHVTVRVSGRATAVALQRKSGSKWRTLVSKPVSNRASRRTVKLAWHVRGGRATLTMRVAALRRKRVLAATRSKRVSQRLPAPPHSGPAGVQPNGTVLTNFDGPGRINVITGASGFSIVDSYYDLGSRTDRSTATTYDVAGNRLMSLSEGALDGECGAADVQTPAGGRLLLTETWQERPAQGVTPAYWQLNLNAWDAQTGRLAWSTAVIPWSADEIGPTSCSAFDGRLEHLAATRDGHWALFAPSPGDPGGTVLDLDTGHAVRADANARAVIGNWIVDQGPGVREGFPAFTFTDAASGTPYGTVQTSRDDGGIDFLNYLDPAPTGMFITSGSSTPAGTSFDGTRLLAAVNDTISGFALPAATALWTLPGDFRGGMIGDGGGVLVTSVSRCGDSSDSCLIGFDDSTGAQLWQLAGSEVCGLSNRQLMIAVNGQLATIDLRTGTQVSYDADDHECPNLRERGLGVSRYGNNGVSVTQVIAP